ncbi:aromatic ring-hydroxylating dioxygenase subunit alpha [Achromobacter sp. 413638]|uniref:aromatic ring-hydroxylating oxygenase subunit alpha n=1 Tax=Achromobacter sp. 413638 TaxID=3342385 RepID=UPI00370A20DD
MDAIASREKYRQYVKPEAGLVSRRIFHDEEIYRAELDRIFKRAWLYLAHESEVPDPGDFVHVYMGEEPVILCRDRDGQLYGLVNSCRHRGNRVCRVDRGNARSFVCSYHGWAYNTKGNLIGVPGKTELYKDDIDQPSLGLVRVARIDSYKGLVFGTFDPEAPSLEEFLGDMRWGLDLLLDQGDLVAAPGVVRWNIEGNWKFAADNAIGDMYHAAWTHRSAMLAGHLGGNGAQSLAQYAPTREQKGITLLAAYGHGLNADFAEADEVDLGSPLAAWRLDPTVQARLGPVRSRVQRSNMNVFPNLFVNSGSRDLMVRHPRGPGRMEVRKTVLVDRNASEETRRMQIRSSNRHFGPAGMFEQDDGENWDQSTHGARSLAARDRDLHYAMKLGRARLTRLGDSPPLIEDLVNEHAQLWLYHCWAEFMDAASWPELRAAHTQPTDYFRCATT